MSARKSARTRGFTLVEVLVALALFAVLMVVVFVPLTQATRFMAVGRTRADLQQAANSTMSQLQRDLSRAIYVYPNSVLPGVTDNAPYGGFAPYYRGATRNATTGNTSRIVMLLPELDIRGNVKYPITPAKYIVTYYARRFTVNTAAAIGSATNPVASAYNNPVVLFRAQYPYADRDGVKDTTIIDTSNARYGVGAGNVGWLTQGNTNLYADEFDLSGLAGMDSILPTTSTNPIIPASHGVVTPRNVALVTPTVVMPTSGDLSPNTTFTCIDSNGDGKIDQVASSLTITNFNRQVSGDGGNNSAVGQKFSENPNFQKFTLNQTLDCPNVR